MVHHVVCYPPTKNSGQEKAHKHKYFWPVTGRWGGSLPVGWPGVKDLCAISGTQGTNLLARYPTGKTGDRGLVQVGMNGDTFSIKAPKECSEKFVAISKGKFLTRGNVLRIFFLFLEHFGAPL